MSVALSTDPWVPGPVLPVQLHISGARVQSVKNNTTKFGVNCV